MYDCECLYNRNIIISFYFYGLYSIQRSAQHCRWSVREYTNDWQPLWWFYFSGHNSSQILLCTLLYFIQPVWMFFAVMFSKSFWGVCNVWKVYVSDVLVQVAGSCVRFRAICHNVFLSPSMIISLPVCLPTCSSSVCSHTIQSTGAHVIYTHIDKEAPKHTAVQHGKCPILPSHCFTIVIACIAQIIKMWTYDTFLFIYCHVHNNYREAVVGSYNLRCQAASNN